MIHVCDCHKTVLLAIIGGELNFSANPYDQGHLPVRLPDDLEDESDNEEIYVSACGADQ